MGIAISKNTINSLIQNTQSIITNYENTCQASGNTAQAQFDANNCTFGSNTKINITATQNINQTCITSETTKESMFSDVRQSMRQSAQAITQSFGFPSISDAETFISNSVKLGERIVNNYYNVCIEKASAAGSGFTCTGSKFGAGTVINIQSYQQITQQCQLTANDTIDLRSMLEVQLSQSSLAQQQNTFAVFAAIFIVIIVVIAYAGISIADNPLVEWGIVILVAISVISSIVYTISAKKNGNYPYNRT